MKKFLRILGIGFTYLALTLVFLFCFLLLVITVLFHGPSEDARDIFTRSCQETSALKFLPYWFLPADTVDTILGKNAVNTPAPVYVAGSYPDLRPEAEKTAEAETSAGAEAAAEEQPAEAPASKRVYVEEVNEGVYKGMMMIVPDPSQVIVGTLPNYSTTAAGKLLPDFIEDYGALGGTNAGGFYDPDGHGKGGCPEGMVLENGVVRYGDERVYKNVIGFTADHRLVLGNWTPSQALNAGVVSAVAFEEGFVLVKDGVASPSQPSGVNPRTAIGQKEDGTMLLLVIEGRHAGSLGATADDLRDIMVRYGAVNASMLDGGTSAVMFFKGEQITRGSNLLGMRHLPTAILVMPGPDDV